MKCMVCSENSKWLREYLFPSAIKDHIIKLMIGFYHLIRIIHNVLLLFFGSKTHVKFNLKPLGQTLVLHNFRPSHMGELDHKILQNKICITTNF